MSTKQDKIVIFDTTLRDGEQSPGATMNIEEKVLIAETLDRMGVDVIEAGFARASEGDFEAVNRVAKAAKNATVCSLAIYYFSIINGVNITVFLQSYLRQNDKRCL